MIKSLFQALEYMFHALKYMFHYLKYMFQTLEQNFHHRENTFIALSYNNLSTMFQKSISNVSFYTFLNALIRSNYHPRFHDISHANPANPANPAKRIRHKCWIGQSQNECRNTAKGHADGRLKDVNMNSRGLLSPRFFNDHIIKASAKTRIGNVGLFRSTLIVKR